MEAGVGLCVGVWGPMYTQISEIPENSGGFTMAHAETIVMPGLGRLLRQWYDEGVLRIVYRTGKPPAYELLNHTEFPGENS